MTTIFATWDKTNRRWKFRDFCFMGSKAMKRRRRNFRQHAIAFIRVPDEMVRGFTKSFVATKFYEWQEKVPLPNRFG